MRKHLLQGRYGALVAVCAGLWAGTPNLFAQSELGIGDTVYIEDYKKTTPFARITILKGFKGVVAGTSLVASFVTSDAKVEAGATFPTFTEVPLEEVIFSKK